MLRKLHHLLRGISREVLFIFPGDKNRLIENIHLCFHQQNLSLLQLFSQRGAGLSALGIYSGKSGEAKAAL